MYYLICDLCFGSVFALINLDNISIDFTNALYTSMPFLVIKSVLREAWTFVIKIILVFCLDVVLL